MNHHVVVYQPHVISCLKAFRASDAFTYTAIAACNISIYIPQRHSRTMHNVARRTAVGREKPTIIMRKIQHPHYQHRHNCMTATGVLCADHTFMSASSPITRDALAGDNNVEIILQCPPTLAAFLYTSIVLLRMVECMSQVLLVLRCFFSAPNALSVVVVVHIAPGPPPRMCIERVTRPGIDVLHTTMGHYDACIPHLVHR